MKKREVHGFDYAVAELLVHLDQLFTSTVEGWKRSKKGFNTKITATSPFGSTVDVIVRPVGWPEDSVIEATLLKQDDGGKEWRVMDGFVNARHIKALKGSVSESFSFSFCVDDNTAPFVYLIRSTEPPPVRQYNEKDAYRKLIKKIRRSARQYFHR